MAPERLTITETEILDALAAQSTTPAPKEYRTIRDISLATGKDERAVRRALHRYQDAGRLLVARVERRGIDGRRATVPAYAILPSKKR